MNRFTLLSMLFLGIFLASCGGPDGTKVASEDAQDVQGTTVASAAYTVDLAASSITWTGTKLGGAHTGNLSLSNGKIAVAEGKIVGGKFTIDMSSLTNTDLDAEQGGNLVGHLKSADFFDVANFGTAEFQIASAQPTDEEGITHQITGNLTLKGETRSITIPANVELSEDKLTATTPDFVIDRTEWGVVYGSSGSFADLAKDKVINDDVGLKLNLVANQ